MAYQPKWPHIGSKAEMPALIILLITYDQANIAVGLIVKTNFSSNLIVVTYFFIVTSLIRIFCKHADFFHGDLI
jgi:hypothetical protein